MIKLKTNKTFKKSQEKKSKEKKRIEVEVSITNMTNL
jgi:hypothetical protein